MQERKANVPYIFPSLWHLVLQHPRVVKTEVNLWGSLITEGYTPVAMTGKRRDEHSRLVLALQGPLLTPTP